MATASSSIDPHALGRVLPYRKCRWILGFEKHRSGWAMRRGILQFVVLFVLAHSLASPAQAQRLQFPSTPSHLRDAQIMTASGPVTMVPLNPATQQGLYPSTATNGSTFDPYATRPSYQNPGVQLPGTGAPAYVPPYGGSPSYPGNGYPGAVFPGTGSSTGGGMFGNPPPVVGAPYGMNNGSLPPTVLPGTSYPGAGLRCRAQHCPVLHCRVQVLSRITRAATRDR